MLFSALSQWMEFLIMMAAGAAAGVWYLAVSGARRGLCGGAVCDGLCDLIFGAGAGGILAVGLYLANGGRVRAFLLIAAGIGFAGFMKWVFRPFAAWGGQIWTKICARCRNLSKKRFIIALFR